MPDTTVLNISPQRTSPDARRPAPCSVWLSAGIARVIAVYGGPPSDGDGSLPVVLAFQCLPYRPPLSRWGIRLFSRPRRPSRGAYTYNRPAPLAQAFAGALLKAAPRAYGWYRTRWSGYAGRRTQD